MQQQTSRLRAATGGAATMPLVVLFALNLVDEFDRVAFTVLSPEIRDAFGLSDSGIVGIASVAGLTALLAALPIGVLADRVRRVRLAGVGAADVVLAHRTSRVSGGTGTHSEPSAPGARLPVSRPPVPGSSRPPRPYAGSAP